MSKFKLGTVFNIPLSNGEFIAGKVIFDFAEHQKSYVGDRVFLGSINDLIAIELYKTTFSSSAYKKEDEILISGLLIGGVNIMKNKWPTLGIEKIDCHNVDFPEFISTAGEHKFLFQKGEISIPLNIPSDDRPQYRVNPGNVPDSLIGPIALYHLGRKKEINVRRMPPDDFLSLKNKDLRFSQHRNFIYEHMGEDPNQTYYEMALKHGIDIKKYYE